ncbi:MAG: hypothetical protein IKC77_02490, partial [Lentisphaeria bacterium]|nr:hypothetical protein [Lentisphaeria bacterium]
NAKRLISIGGCSVSQGRVLRPSSAGSVRLYMTEAAQQQGTRLTTMRHRRKFFFTTNGTIIFIYLYLPVSGTEPIEK